MTEFVDGAAVADREGWLLLLGGLLLGTTALVRLGRFGVALLVARFAMRRLVPRIVPGPRRLLGRVLPIPRIFPFPRLSRFDRYGVIGFGLLGLYIASQSVSVFGASSGTVLEGRVTHVRDGDTIVVGSTPLRFQYLDCAERGTPAGDHALRRMRALAAGQSVSCTLAGRMSYDRQIGTCRLAGGVDLGAELRRDGTCSRYW